MTDPVKIIVGEGDITEVQVPEYGIIQTGGGGGGGGSDGATFFPEVSQEGVISWTNDGGYDNPEPVNIKGPAGNDGSDGEDGVTFTPSVSNAGIISWTNDGDLPNPSPVNIKGSDGEDGEDGISPAVTFGTITGGHTMTVTDKTHPTGQTINIMDGAQGQTGPGVPAGGSTGQVLAKKSNADNDTEWVNQSGGGGGTTDYDDLTNQPSINGTTLSGNKTAAELGLAAASDIPTVPVQSVNGKTGAVVLSASDVGAGTYSKPSGGIPKSDLASAVQSKLDNTVVVSDTQPTATENKLWVDTDAGAGSAYQVPTVAEMDAADNTILGNLAMIESSPATAAHAVGEYIVLNGHLYKVTAAIAAGQTLTIGTNITAAKIADDFAESQQVYQTQTITYGSRSFVEFFKVGHIVSMRARYSASDGTLTAWNSITLGNIPAAYRPPYNLQIAAVTDRSTSIGSAFSINPNGNVDFNPRLSQFTDASDNAYVYVCYFVA